VIMRELNEKLAYLPAAQAFAFAPPAIPGVGTSGGATFMLEDRSGSTVEFLAKNTDTFLEAARKRPEFSSVTTTFIPSVPQVYADVDRDKVLKQGVDLSSVYKTLQAFMGGSFVNYFNRFGRVWQVYVQAEGEARTKASNVGQFYVLNGQKEQVPLSTLVEARRSRGPDLIERFNVFPAAKLMGNPAPGYTSGQAIAAMQAAAAEVLSNEYQIGWTGSAYQELQASGTGQIAFVFGILMVFLILAAQYERWSLPLAVVTAVPFAVFGAILAIWMRGLSVDLYFQVGMLVLIGLAAKNAILIVEFAVLSRKEGLSIRESAINAARLRFRPIVMTSLAFIMGVLPLAVATGAGANSRHSIGTGVIGGMLAATAIAIVFVPLFYRLVEQAAEKLTGRRGKAPADSH